MPGYFINRLSNTIVPISVLFIGILSFFIQCKSDNNKISLVEPLSESDILRSDYIEPGIKWGYIDVHGEMVIREQFDDCRNFSQGLAAASIHGLWGYIDHNGKWVVKPEYRGTWTFKDGLGRVKVLDGKFGYLDTLGHLVIDTIWEEGEEFSEGFTKVRKDNRFQFIDKSGGLLSPESWDMAFAFKNGYARVSNGGWWGLLDRKGNLVIQVKYEDLGQIANNRIPVELKGLWGYLDSLGKVRIEPKYEEVSPFQGQYAAAKKGSHWIIIDQTGQTHSLDFDFIQVLGENRWGVQKRDSFALLNNDGRLLTPFKYTQINQFHENKAVFRQDDLFMISGVIR